MGRALTEGRHRARAGPGPRPGPAVDGHDPAAPAPCLDPDLAFVAPDSVVRRIHGDLPAMLIGGLSALLFQMLHPLAMAGVAQHSNYRQDPLGRLERTASFLGTTTFGTVDEARAAIDRVRRVHVRVRGVASDGRPYCGVRPRPAHLGARRRGLELPGRLPGLRADAAHPGRGRRLPRPDGHGGGRPRGGATSPDRPPSSTPTSPRSDPACGSPPRPAPPATSCCAAWAAGRTRSPPTACWSAPPRGSCPPGPDVSSASRRARRGPAGRAAVGPAAGPGLPVGGHPADGGRPATPTR